MVERVPFRKRCADASARRLERRATGRLRKGTIYIGGIRSRTRNKRLASSNTPASPQVPFRSLDGEQRCEAARMLLRDSAALPSLQALGAASSAFSRARVVERSTPGSRQLERLEHGVTVKGSAACSYARAHHPTELQTHACYTCTKHCVRTVAEQCGRAQRGLSPAWLEEHSRAPGRKHASPLRPRLSRSSCATDWSAVPPCGD